MTEHITPEEPISAVVARAMDAVDELRPRFDRCPPSFLVQWRELDEILGRLEAMRRQIVFLERSPYGTGEVPKQW